MAYNIGTAFGFPFQFFTDSGLVASGYKLFTYLAGTTTKVTTYTIADLSASNTDPITLDSAGRCVIFLSPLLGHSYKYVLATPTTADPPAGGDIIETWDNMGIVPNADANIDILGEIADADVLAGKIVAMPQNRGGIWTKSNPAAASTSIDAIRLGVMVSDTVIGAQGIIRIQGKYPLPGLVVGSSYYLSSTTGELTATPPTGANHIVPFGAADVDGDLVFPDNAMFRVGTRLALKSFGYSAGQANAAGAGDTQLTSYDVAIPPGILDQPGACLVVEGTLAIAANADAKTFKLRVEGGTLVTVWGSSANVVGQIVPFRVLLYYRTQTTGSMTGIAYHGAAAGGAPTNYLCNSSVATVNWGVGSQTLKAFASANTVDSVRLTDYTVYVIRSYQGATV